MAKKKEITYNDAMARIEAILTRLRDQETDVDTLGDAVREASELIALCRRKLTKADEEVRKALDDDRA